MVLGASVTFGVGEGVSVRPGVGVRVAVGSGVGVGVEKIAATGPPRLILLTRNNTPARRATTITAAPAITPIRNSIALESPTRPRRFLAHSKASGVDGIGW